MGKYRMNEPYGYQEVVGFTSLKSEMDGEMSSNKKTDEQQSAEIKAESEAREKADKQLDARVKALEEASGGGSSSDIEDKVDELEQAVNTLNGSGEGSVKKTAEDAAAAAVKEVVDDAPEMYDTLKEVADYIESSEEDKAEMQNSISNLESAVSGKADADSVYTKEAVDEKVADLATQNALDEEIQRATSAETKLEESIAAIVVPSIDGLAPESALTELEEAIEEENHRAVSAETELRETIDAIVIPSTDGFAPESALTELEEAIEEESQRAISAETKLEESIAAIVVPSIDGLAPESALTELEEAIETESQRAISAETDLREAIEAIDMSEYATTEQVENEINTAIAAIEIPSVKGLASEEYVDEEIGKVVGAAPENFDTLKEFADALAELKVVDQPAVEGEHYTQEECDEYNTSHGLEPGDDGYITTDDWKVEPQAEVSHNMTIGEFVNTAMESVNEKPEVNALNEKVNALENALKRVDANAYQTMMNDLEVLDTLKDANSVTITEGTIADIVVPETTRSKTINGELDPNSTVSLTSRYGLTINNSGSETTNVEINAPAVEGYNAATVTLNGGEYDTITLTDASLTTNTAATVQNIVITEETTKALTINAMFESGATVTSYSDAPITITNKNAEGEEASITINASGSTVTLSGGKWEVVEGSFSDDTLIIKKFAKIKDLTVTKGNVIVEVPRQSDIASVITGNIDIAEGYTIDYNKVDVTQDNMSALKGTAECTLQGDITTTTAFVAPLSPAWDTVWNLNGHTMEVNTTGGRGGLMVRYSSSVEFNGPGTFRNNTDYGVWLASTGGTLTINGGTFEAKTHVVYAQQGVITINGGVFKFVDPDNEEKDENGNFKFLVNCLDSSYSSKTANVIIKGGKFYGWNPSASYGEPNAPANFVAAGFHVVETVEDGMKVYEVVED